MLSNVRSVFQDNAITFTSSDTLLRTSSIMNREQEEASKEVFDKKLKELMKGTTAGKKVNVDGMFLPASIQGEMKNGDKTVLVVKTKSGMKALPVEGVQTSEASRKKQEMAKAFMSREKKRQKKHTLRLNNNQSDSEEEIASINNARIPIRPNNKYRK